jgi:hypothetical protein
MFMRTQISRPSVKEECKSDHPHALQALWTTLYSITIFQELHLHTLRLRNPSKETVIVRLVAQCELRFALDGASRKMLTNVVAFAMADWQLMVSRAG